MDLAQFVEEMVYLGVQVVAAEEVVLLLAVDLLEELVILHP